MKNGWPTKTLGEVCQFRGGGTPSKAIERYWRGNIPWVSPKDMKFDVVSDSIDHISQEAIDGSTTSLIPKGSVLIVVRSGILARTVPIAISGRDLTINQDLKALCPNRAVDARFLYHLLDSKMDVLLSMVSRGATVHRLITEQIRALDFTLPPLAEQQRMVGLLDEAFADIATATTNAEKNLQNTRALFESHLQSVLRSKKWKWKTLGDLCNDVEYGSAAKSKTEGKVPVLRMGNIQGGRLDWRDLVYTDDKDEVEKYLLKHNDVLFNRTNSPELVGKTAIYKGKIPAIFAGYLIRIHRKEDLLDADYLTYFLNSQIAFDYGKTVVISSVNQANINGTKLKSYPIPAPSLSEQKAIVAKLDALAEETQRLATLYTRKLAALEALKKSLLHQAFTGELTRTRYESKIIPFPVTIPNIAPIDLHAGILAMAYQLHEVHGKQAEFGHVKAEKIAHMIEALVGIDLGRCPVKDAAGPNDFPHLHKVEHRAKMADYFRFQRVESAAYQVTKGQKIDELVARTESALGNRRSEVDTLLKMMLPMNTHQAGIFATVYAAWNNLLLDGKPISDEAIVHEARENWHSDKLNISRKRFFDAIRWIRTKGIIPAGRGKRVGKKSS